MAADTDRAEAPVELRFLELFLLIILALICAVVALLPPRVRWEAPPRIQTRAVPAAMVGERYHLTLAARGGAAPLRWRVTEGELPPGLLLRGNMLQGVPTATGTQSVVIEVEDANARRDTARFELRVREHLPPGERPQPLAVEAETVALPTATAGEEYRQSLSAAGGTPPYSWAVVGESLPQLTLDSNGVLSGRPTGERPAVFWSLFAGDTDRREKLRELNTSRFVAAVTDARGRQRVQVVRVTVDPPPRPFVWQLLLVEFAEPVGWWWHVTGWALRVGVYICFLGLLLIPLVPLILYLTGYQQVLLTGWPGVLARPTPGAGGRTLSPVVSVFAAVVQLLHDAHTHLTWRWRWIPLGVPVSVVLTVVLAEWLPPAVAVGVLVVAVVAPAALLVRVIRSAARLSGPALSAGGGGGGGGHVPTAPVPPFVPTPPSPRQQTAPRPPAPNRAEPDEQFLDNLRRGGRVPFGGAFLGLAFVRERQLDQVVTQGYGAFPEVGRGLLHTALDAYFRRLLGWRASGSDAGLDDRFDVILGRRGPATDEAATDPEGPITLPEGEQFERGGEDPPDDSPLGEHERALFTRLRIRTHPAALARYRTRGAGQMLTATMTAAAGAGLRWLAERPVELGHPPVGRHQLQRLLRSPADVRLTGGVVEVRLVGLSAADRPAAERLCAAVNATHPRTIGRHELPLVFRCEQDSG